MARTYVLPDGRILSASLLELPGGETPSFGPMWELWLTPGAHDEVSVGHPLNSFPQQQILRRRQLGPGDPDGQRQLPAQSDQRTGRFLFRRNTIRPGDAFYERISGTAGQVLGRGH